MSTLMVRTMQLMQIRTALEVKVLSINRAKIKNMYTSPVGTPLPHIISTEGWLPPLHGWNMADTA